MGADLVQSKAAKGGTLDEEDRADLVALLEDALQWHMPEAGWDRVESAAALLDQALDGDGDVHRTTAALMLAGPRRVGSGLEDTLNEPAPTPVPDRTRELLNKLIERIGAAPTGDGPGDDDAT